MDLDLIRIIQTVALFVLFIVLIALVYNKKNKTRFDEAANLVFDDGDDRSDKINQKPTKVQNENKVEDNE